MNPKTLIGSADSLQMFPAQYPWAWEMYLENQKNHWTPLQIPSANDVADWKGGKLSEDERHLFLTVMAQLTTFDVLRGDETSETLQLLISSPEIKHYLKLLSAEEALHTWSYQSIIENLNLNQEDIYTRYRRETPLFARIKYAGSFTDKLTNTIVNILHAKAQKYEYKFDFGEIQRLLEALIFWFACFEGVWFYMNLTGPVLNLARQGKMMGTAEQFQYILRDELQHIRFGTRLINELVKEYPEVMTKQFRTQILNMFEKTLHLETDFIRHALPRPVFGYNVEDHIETTKHIMNKRALAINFPAPYPRARNRLPWIQEMMLSRKEKNFFETHVTEYQTGGALTWDD